MPGCIEHSSMIWEAIQQAKKNRLDLHVIWLDLANAYGAVPHSLLWKALEMCHVPDSMIDILKQYFSNFQMRFQTAAYVTDWTKLEVGIAMGCTVSPILFVLAMQILLKATEASTVMVKLGKGIVMPPLKAFMDDTTVLANKASMASKILKRLEELMVWSRMKFKPAKSRSLSLKKGKLDEQVQFHIEGQPIPTISEVPVKSLGRWYDHTLRDTRQGKNVVEIAQEGLRAINQTKLQGKFKLWILQFVLIPKLMWPLQVYEIGLSTVEAIERTINKFSRKWLGLPPGLSTAALYSRSAKLRLPLKALTEEFKVGKARLQMMLSQSSDPAVRGASVQVKSGSKWKAQEEVEKAIEAAKFREVMGATQTGRQGLGFGNTKRKWWSKATRKEKQDLVVEEIRYKAESDRVQAAVQQKQQGQWTTWDEALQRAVSWNDIWYMAPLHLSFIIRSVYDQLPTGDNLIRWHLVQEAKCALCSQDESLNHVLSSCKVALGSGRYTWRHNQVLKVLVEAVELAKGKANDNAGASQEKHTKATGSMLEAAKDWVVAADIPGMRNYPQVIRQSNCRPDIVLISQATRMAVIIELTVPFETNMSGSHEFKLAKYEALVSELHEENFKSQLFAVEVGARGLVGASMYSLIKRLGLDGKARTRCMKQLSEVAAKASQWLWVRRKVKVWSDQVGCAQ